MWLPKVKDNYFLAGHDYSGRWGTVNAVNELKKQLGKKILEFKTFNDTSWIMRIKK